mgnify:CR=1 FL=1
MALALALRLPWLPAFRSPGGAPPPNKPPASCTIIPYCSLLKKTARPAASQGLAVFRLAMLPEVENVYLQENYEQRITLDTQKVEEFIPEIML